MISLNLFSQSKKIIYKLSLIMIFLGVFFSYLLSDIHSGQNWINESNLGWLTVCQYIYLSFFMLIAWWSVPKFQTLKQASLLLIVALLLRLILIPVDSYTSNDVDRYLFDGKIVLTGLDPYQINHNDPRLEELKKQWAPPEEHAKYSTLYPPLSLGLFSLVASTGAKNALIVWKLVVTIAGILTVFFLALLLEKLKRLRHLPLIALSPLLILETGIGVHIDSITTLLVTLVLFVFYKKRLILSGFFIGLGVLTKILPIMLLLPLFFGLKKITDSLKIGIFVIVTILVGYIATIASGLIPVGSIGVLFEKWRFGSPVFTLLETFVSGQWLLFIVLGIIVSSCIIIAIKAFKLNANIKVTDPLLQWSMLCVLLVSPVIFPWYLMPLVPLLVLLPRPFLLTWLCSLPLTYEVMGGFASTGAWSPATWPLIVITLGFSISLYFEFAVSKNRIPLVRAQANRKQASIKDL